MLPVPSTPHDASSPHYARRSLAEHHVHDLQSRLLSWTPQGSYCVHCMTENLVIVEQTSSPDSYMMDWVGLIAPTLIGLDCHVKSLWGCGSYSVPVRKT